MFTTTRYFKNKVLKTEENKRFLSTWTKIKPLDLESQSDIFVRMNSESRLDILAQTYLGNSKYWWIISMLNGMKHMWDWKVGDVLRIPVNPSRFLTAIQGDINK